MKIIKENYKFLLVIIGILLLFNIHFPYYIDAPGGISDVSSKIEIDGYKSEGSFNLAYVKEYRATMSSSNPTPGCLFEENHNSEKLAQPYLQDMETT